jgi:hypothetical protein
MVGITNRLEYLKELEKLTLKVLQSITDVNDLCGFGAENGFDGFGFEGDIDFQDFLTDSLTNIRSAIKAEELDQYDEEAEADLKDYLKSIDDAYQSAKAGSK